jgi:hypothetical protein
MPDIQKIFLGGEGGLGLSNYKTSSHDYQKPNSQVHEKAGRGEKGGKHC